jgi:hypothetical protein
MNRNETSVIIDPMVMGKIRDVSYNYMKLESSKIIAESLCDTINLNHLFNRICEHTDKKIVYGIKKRRGKEVVEIYLCYFKDEFSYEEYLDEVISLLILLGNNSNPDTHANIKQTMIDKQVTVVSYEFDESGDKMENYLDIYSLEGKTHRYNLSDDTLTCVSIYRGYSSNELKNVLEHLINVDCAPNVINDISRIIPTIEDESIVTNIVVHKKLAANGIGIYFSPVDITGLRLLLHDRFGKSLPNNDTLNDLVFGVHLDYDLTDGKVIGVGFCDYF